jgi:hypothetical protein
LIDALHGPARQILHVASPVAASGEVCGSPRVRSSKDGAIVALPNCGVKKKPHKLLGLRCRMWKSWNSRRPLPDRSDAFASLSRESPPPRPSWWMMNAT